MLFWVITWNQNLLLPIPVFMRRQLQNFGSLLSPPHHAFLNTGPTAEASEHQPCSLWSAASSLHAWSWTTMRPQHCPTGIGLQATHSGPWQEAKTWWLECSHQFLPNNCFYLIKPTSVPSPAHTNAHANAHTWKWFGIVHITKPTSGRNDLTAIGKWRSNVEVWRK